MVFCGVNEKHFDKILFELRRKQIPVDYKAVLTPSNRKWSVLMLMLELTKEKTASGRETETEQGQIRTGNGQACRFLYEM